MVLRFGGGLATELGSILDGISLINRLHQIYMNIFGKSALDKHDSNFVYLSMEKIITQFRNFFEKVSTFFFFCNGGSHHYKSRHGFFAFAHIVRLLKLTIQVYFPAFLGISMQIIMDQIFVTV